MPLLKLFVSHSSRLDDVDHDYPNDNRNWQLLEDTCQAIRDKYEGKIDVLVDKDRLKPGDDWNDRLNIWLQECHIAIVLFSKRAIEKSGWVAKEVTILSWRAAIDQDFRLIPVTIKGETTPEELTIDFLGVLQMGRWQCISDVEKAEDILDGLADILSKLESLSSHPLTPLEILQEGIARILVDSTEASLGLAVKAVCHTHNDQLSYDKNACAALLARQFLQTDSAKPVQCFSTFERGIGSLTPRPIYSRAYELFKYIRPLWVEPSDVAFLRSAVNDRQPLAFLGRYTHRVGPDQKTEHYTLERFIERAWPGESDKFLVVSVTLVGSVDFLTQCKKEIWRKAFRGRPPPNGPKEEKSRDDSINRGVRTIVLLISAPSDSGGLPDPGCLVELNQLFEIYKDKLLMVYNVGEEKQPIKGNVKYAQPRLDEAKELAAFINCEESAYWDESRTKTYLDDTFGPMS